MKKLNKSHVELLAVLREIGEAGLRERTNELAPRIVAMANEACAEPARILSGWNNDDQGGYISRLIRETATDLTRYRAKRFASLWPISYAWDETDPVYPVTILGESNRLEERGERGACYRISWPVWSVVRDSFTPLDLETYDLAICRQFIESDLYTYKSVKERLDKLGIDPEDGTVFAA